MFNINCTEKRYFTIKIGDIVLDVEPPTKKVLNKVIELAQSKGPEVVDGLFKSLQMILNKNKSGYTVPDSVIDDLDMDQVSFILREYFKWISETKNSPN